MIRELFNLTRKKISKYLLMIIIFCTVFTLIQLKPSTDYNDFYNTYSNQLEIFKDEGSFLLIPVSNEGNYIYYQLKYLVNRQETIDVNIDMLKRKINSSLFRDDLKQLNKELLFEENKSNITSQFHNTYVNEKILNNKFFIYCTYIVGIIIIVSIFYDDIKNKQLPIYKTYQLSIKKLFAEKFITFLFVISTLLLMFCMIEIIFLDNNYSVYYMRSLSETYINMNLIEFIICKYINALFNIILLSLISIIFLLITRHYALTTIIVFLIFFIEFFCFYIFVSKVKYCNLYYLLFLDYFQYNGINDLLIIFKIILSIILFGLFYVIYIKDIFIRDFKNNKKTLLKTTFVPLHVLNELLIQSKGIYAIVIVLLFSIYQYNTFEISFDYKEMSYRTYQKDYLGAINDETYNDILKEYQIVQETYIKFLKLEKEAIQNQEQSLNIYSENEDIILKAQDMNHIERLKQEYEEAMELGLVRFVDNSGANILLMKNQYIYVIECLAILSIPLILVYISFINQINHPTYKTIINTSYYGEKNYLRLSHFIFNLLVLFNTMIIFLGHCLKVNKLYNVDLSYTLKDVLYVNIELSLLCTLCLSFVVVVLFIILITRIIDILIVLFNKDKS